MLARSTYLLFQIALLSVSLSGISQAGIKLESSMTNERTMQPGDSYRGFILLRNTDSVSNEAKIYQTDYSFSADGRAYYDAPGRLPRSNAKWIDLSQEVVTIPPNGTQRVDYEVTVPRARGSELSGTYWSMIMVEPISKNSAESAANLPERTTQITQVLRYGVQVISNIGKTDKVGLAFANPQLLKEDGERFFAIDVENTGNRWLSPGLSLELYSESGTPIGKFQGPAKRLYPSTSARFQIDLAEVPKGKYLGLVVADGTGDNLFGANVELEIE
jgi:hypothetical protein